MTFRQVVAIAFTALLGLTAVTGCTSTEPPKPTATTIADAGEPTAPVDTDTPSSGTPGSDSPRTGPHPKPGRSDAAVASVCEAFVVGYGEFSPFDFDPSADWQARWSRYATPQLLGREQLRMRALWSWTWERKVKAFDVHILSPGRVSGTGSARTVGVRADRLILGMDETGDKAVTEQLTFTCDMLLPVRDGDYAKVDGIAQFESPRD